MSADDVVVSAGPTGLEQRAENDAARVNGRLARSTIAAFALLAGALATLALILSSWSK